MSLTTRDCLVHDTLTEQYRAGFLINNCGGGPFTAFEISQLADLNAIVKCGCGFHLAIVYRQYLQLKREFELLEKFVKHKKGEWKAEWSQVQKVIKGTKVVTGSGLAMSGSGGIGTATVGIKDSDEEMGEREHLAILAQEYLALKSEFEVLERFVKNKKGEWKAAQEWAQVQIDSLADEEMFIRGV